MKNDGAASEVPSEFSTRCGGPSLKVLRRDFLQSMKWVLGSRWALLYLAFGVLVNQANRLLILAMLDRHQAVLIPSSLFNHNWMRLIQRHLADWTTYLYGPLSYVGRAIVPFRTPSGLATTVPVLVLVGLWVFRLLASRSCRSDEGQSGYGFFVVTLNVLSLIGVVTLAVPPFFGFTRRPRPTR